MEFFAARMLLIASAAIEVAFAVAAARWIGRDATFPVYLTLYFAMAVPWLFASYVAIGEQASRRSDRALVLGVALLLRLALLPSAPVLSDDIFRYVWDGRVQHAGIDPYLHPPEAPELAFLRDELYEEINNKDIPTIYPPLMQEAFFLVAAVSTSVLWMKICFVLIDLTLVLLLTHLASNPIRALVYAWCPLAVVEVAGSGHNDVLGAFLLVAALVAFDRGRPAVTMALLTASGLAKLLGLALAPLFARVVSLRHFAVVPLVAVLVAAPYVSAGRFAFRGLFEYGSRWRANDSLFHLLFAVTGSLDVAKLVAGAILVAMTLVLVLRRTPPQTACFLVVSAVLLLSPTVHPWYLLWALPFLPLFPSPAWMFLSISIGLSYHAAYLASPGAPWEELLWVKALEYGPFYGLLLVSALGRLGSHDTRSTS